MIDSLVVDFEAPYRGESARHQGRPPWSIRETHVLRVEPDGRYRIPGWLLSAYLS